VGFCLGLSDPTRKISAGSGLAFGRRVRQRQRRPHYCSCAVRLNFQSSAQLTEAFPHSAKPYSSSARRAEFQLFVHRYAFAVILNFDENPMILLMHAYRSGSTARMTMNIGKAFLDHSKNCDFHLVREPAKLGWNIQVNFNLTAFREAIHILAKR
jgi:hypothetical protein